MSVMIKLPQTELVGFLRGNCSEETNRKVRYLRKEYSEYERLLEIAEDVCQDRAIDLNIDPPERMMASEDFNQLLENLYTWNSTRENKQQFVKYLFHSETFYEKLMTNFLEAEEIMLMAEAFPIIEELPLGKSDREFLQELGIDKEPNRIWEKVANAYNTFLENTSTWCSVGLAKLLEILNRGPRVVIPLALTFLISCSGVTRVSWLHYASPFKDRQIQAEPFAYDQSLLGQAFTELPMNMRSGEEVNKEAFIRDYEQAGWALKTLLPVFQAKDYDTFLENVSQEHSRIATLEMEIEKMNRSGNLPDTLRRKLPSAQGMVHAYYLHSGISSLALYLDRNKAVDDIPRRDYLLQAVKNLQKAKTLSGNYGYASHEQESYFLGMAFAYFYEDEKNEMAIKNFSEVKPESKFYERAQKLKDWLE